MNYSARRGHGAKLAAPSPPLRLISKVSPEAPNSDAELVEQALGLEHARPESPTMKTPLANGTGTTTTTSSQQSPALSSPRPPHTEPSCCRRSAAPVESSIKPGALRQTLSANIRRVAEEHHLTLKCLAARAEVSRAQLYNVLAARSSASLDWIERIAEVLGVAPHDLLVPLVVGSPIAR